MYVNKLVATDDAPQLTTRLFHKDLTTMAVPGELVFTTHGSTRVVKTRMGTGFQKSIPDIGFFLRNNIRFLSEV